MFDKIVYNGQNNRLSISSGSDIYQYLSTYFFVALYDELGKANNRNPYPPDNNQTVDQQQIDQLVNSTNHFIGDFNYIVGIRLTYRRILWKNNTNQKFNKVFNYKKDSKIFDMYSQYDEYKLPLQVPNSNKTFFWIKDDGQYQTGAYTDFYKSSLTLAQVLQQLNDTYNAGWYDDNHMLYFGIELITYNSNHRNGAIFRIDFTTNPAFDLSTNYGQLFPIYPTDYDDLKDPRIVLRIIFYVILTICFAANTIVFFYGLYKHLKEVFNTKNILIPYEIFFEFPLIGLTTYTLYQWFGHFLMRNTFFLPIQSQDDYNICTLSSWYVFNYLKIAPIVVILYLIKCLQIFAVYIPSFGVLFDTLNQLKNEGMPFFILVFISMSAFTVSGFIWFGNWLPNYKTIWSSALQVFYILVNSYTYEDLAIVNPIGSRLFFYPANIIIFQVYFFMFQSITLKVYDKIRTKRQLESEARARILVNNYKWRFHLWINFLLCRMDRRTKKELFEKDNSQIQKEKELNKQQKLLNYLQNKNNIKVDIALISELNVMKSQFEKQQSEQNQQKSILAIYLYNKVRIFHEKEVITKEDQEKEILETKKMIIREKKVDHIMTLINLKKTGKNFSKDFTYSLCYLIYIIIFVSMLLLQLQIQNVIFIGVILAPTNQQYLTDGKVYYDLSSFQQNYTNTPQNNNTHQHSINDPDDMIYNFSQNNPSINFDSLNSVTDIQSWLLLKLYVFLYSNIDSNGTFLMQNKYFGDSRARITITMQQVQQNTYNSTNKSIPLTRKSEMQQLPYIQSKANSTTFKGSFSNRTYTFYKEGSLKTYNQQPGIVIILPKDDIDAYQQLKDLSFDNILNASFDSMIIEMGAYNPNFKMFMYQMIQFQQSNAGLVNIDQYYRSFKMRLYYEPMDFIRVILEMIFAIYISSLLIQQILRFIKIWKRIYLEKKGLSQIALYSENPGRIRRLYNFIGVDSQQLFQKKWIIIIVYTIFYAIIWIFSLTVRFIQTLIRFVANDVFELLNLINAILSTQLIITWIIIIDLSYTKFNQEGLTEDLKYTYIDIISKLSLLYQKYNLICALNTFIIFWRIFQFFKFSPKLSTFTQILKQSKSDTLYFLVILIFMLIGFGIMGNLYFGANLKQYSDYTLSILTLLGFSNFYYDDQFFYYSDLAALLLVSFQIIFTMMLLNMLVGIMMSHYQEYEEQQAIINMHNKNERVNSFLQLCFILIKRTVDRQRFQTSKYRIFQTWHQFWERLEILVFPDNSKQEEEKKKFLQIQKQQIQNDMHNAYSTPSLGKQHKFIQPFIQEVNKQYLTHNKEQQLKRNSEEEINSDYKTSIQLTTERKIDNEVEFLLSGKNEENDQNNSLIIKKQQNVQYDNQNNDLNFQEIKKQEQRVLEDLNIGIMNKIISNLTLDDKTSIVLWSSCLEKELFSLSNNQILFSDFLSHTDKIGKINNMYVVHDPEQFKDFQVSFIAIESQNDQINKWNQANIEVKFQLWEIMDFQKRFENENAQKTEESISTFYDFMLQSNNGKLNQQEMKPILSFKKIKKCVELNNREYSRASQLQKNLWLYHTNNSDKFQLWFIKFNSYYKTKLWNSLTFSEDYALNIINQQKHTRQDLALNVLWRFIQIRGEILGLQELELENLRLQLHLESETKIVSKKNRILNEKEEKLKKSIQQIKERRIAIQDIVKDAPTKMRQKYMDPDFFLQVWKILKEEQYFIKSKQQYTQAQNKATTQSFQQNEKEQTNKKMDIIDQYDLEEQKIVKPFFQVGNNDNLSNQKIQNLFTKQSLKMSFQKKNSSIIQNEEFKKTQKKMFQSFKDLQEIKQKQRQYSAVSEQTELQMKVKLKDEELAKIDSTLLLHTQRKYFQIMLAGKKGSILEQMKEYVDKSMEKFIKQFQKTINQNGQQDYQNTLKKRKMLLRYKFLLQNLGKHEHRLVLWLGLSLKEKLKMLVCQQIEEEAEIMIMLILEEIDFIKKGQSQIEQLDQLMERALDSLIFEKYQKLAENQALYSTQQQIDQLISKTYEEDKRCVEYCIFLQNKDKFLSDKYLVMKKQAEKLANFNKVRDSKMHRKRLMSEKTINEEQQINGEDDSDQSVEPLQKRNTKNVEINIDDISETNN